MPTLRHLDFFDFPFPKSHGHVSTLCQHAQNGVPELVEFSRKPTIDQLQSVSFPRHRAVVCGRCNHGLFSSTYWRIPIDQVRTSKSWIRMLSFGASCTANPLRREFQPHPSWPNTLLGYLWISWGFTDQPNWSRFLFCCRLNHHYPHLRAFSQPFPSENLTLFLSPGWGF